MANSLEDLGGRRHFDYIVIGCGGVGSGSLFWLSKRAGPNVLGLERFPLAHENGGSQDWSRIIRLTYPDDLTTKLAPHSFECWEQVEKESKMQVVHKCGGLTLAEKGQTEDIMAKYERAMTKANIHYEKMNNQELMARYPQFTVGPDVMAIWQKDAGIVDAALGNSLHVQLAQGRGAKVLDNCPVNRVSRAKNGFVEVSTPLGVFTCKKVVVTAGAWINHILSSVGAHVPVYVSEENVTYFATPHMHEFTKQNFPMFIWHTPANDIYALPCHVNSGAKIGVDAGGKIVSGDKRSWTPDPERLKLLQNFCSKNIPKFLGPVMRTKCCLYTMTPDRTFLVDTADKYGFPDMIVCCGAGHAFKFASVLGKVLSELAVDGKTQYDISGYNWDRPALTDPNFSPIFHLSKIPNQQSNL